MVSKNTYRNACLIALLTIITGSVGIMSGCGTTQQANLWADPSYHAAPITKILVIAMSRDQIRRRMWEDAIVTALDSKEHAGTAIVASYQLFPDDLPDTLAMRQETQNEGFDGVLLVARAQLDTLSNDVPGYTTNEPVTRYSRRWDAYVTRYEDVYHPGYTETETSVSVRTDL